jgi:hypothetical protein
MARIRVDGDEGKGAVNGCEGRRGMLGGRMPDRENQTYTLDKCWEDASLLGLIVITKKLSAGRVERGVQKLTGYRAVSARCQ